MQISISIEGMFDLTWPRWKRLVTAIEGLGFAGLFRSDHFTLMDAPDPDALETIVSLTYLAAQSQRVHFGTLVAPVSFRDPVMLARQAMALDDLSNGRMILGVGSGWLTREHTMFGYNLGDVTTRMDRLEEALEVMTRLIRSDEPFTFTGRFYQLHEAHLLPRPQRPTPVMVGGNGPKRTLPLVARYADIWNCVAKSPELFAERSARLDELLRAEGRQPQDLKRTIMIPIVCWRTPQEREARAQQLRNSFTEYSAKSTEAIFESLRVDDSAIVGAPEQVIEQLQRFADAGAEEVMIQWIAMEDIDGLAAIAESILPHFMP